MTVAAATEVVGGAAFTDPCDARLALRAPGSLGVFNAAGVLNAADVHVALRLGRFGEEADDAVLLAAALAVRAPRLGHVHVDLAAVRHTATVDVDVPVDLQALPWPDVEPWVEAVGRSAMVANGEDRPRGPAAAPDRIVALPRPLLAGGAPGGRRPRRPGRTWSGRHRRGLPAGRPRPALPGWRGAGAGAALPHRRRRGRGGRPATVGRGRGGAAALDGGGRRAGDGEDHDRGPDPGPARGAGPGRRGAAAAGGPHRPDREGRRPARGSGPRRGRPTRRQ